MKIIKQLSLCFVCLLVLSTQFVGTVEAKTNPYGTFMKSTLEAAKANYLKFKATGNKKYFKELDKVANMVEQNDFSRRYNKTSAEYREYQSYIITIIQLYESALYSLEKDKKSANEALADAKKNLVEANKLLKYEGMQPVVFK
ncbi:hypothetical protein [Aneurinibacillus tyrosinisolvens]|uniref:hypothetical protein n=1 Tax=Aneurinibacillus tyrosinisolvens TaxID=1443435 RepID=UPI00063F05E1|nr:hypothetical protein [Aneurinibacillus tyrosinisolvens]